MAAPLLLNEESHERPFSLSHRNASSSYVEIAKTSGQVSSVVTWTDNTKTYKLREVLFAYSGMGLITTVTKKQYDGLGNLLNTLTGVLVRDSNSVVTNVTWTLT